MYEKNEEDATEEAPAWCPQITKKIPLQMHHLAVRRSRETASWKEDVAKERTTSPRAHVVVRRAAALRPFFAVDFFN
jgi:hypothetical protein